MSMEQFNEEWNRRTAKPAAEFVPTAEQIAIQEANERDWPCGSLAFVKDHPEPWTVTGHNTDSIFMREPGIGGRGGWFKATSLRKP